MAEIPKLFKLAKKVLKRAIIVRDNVFVEAGFITIGDMSKAAIKLCEIYKNNKDINFIGRIDVQKFVFLQSYFDKLFITELSDSSNELIQTISDICAGGCMGYI